MSKRMRFLPIGLICAILLFTVVFLLAAFEQKQPAETTCTNTDGCETLHWVREESHFIDCSVEGDTVSVQYAFVFENHSNHVFSCNHLSAKFRRKDLWGWMKYQKFFTGICEDGSDGFTVGSGEKIEVILTFPGTYTGGAVNNNLSLPTKIVFLKRIIEP